MHWFHCILTAILCGVLLFFLFRGVRFHTTLRPVGTTSHYSSLHLLPPHLQARYIHVYTYNMYIYIYINVYVYVCIYIYVYT